MTELLAALLVTIGIPVTGLLVFAIVRWGSDAEPQPSKRPLDGV